MNLTSNCDSEFSSGLGGAMWPILICLLGPFRVVHAGHPLAIRGEKAAALLCHLALRGHDGVPRETRVRVRRRHERINHGGYTDSLGERFPGALRPGPLVDVQGVTVGEHAGSGADTVGQRKGWGVALNGPSPPGQAIALYDDDAVLAGATIADTVPAAS